MKTTNYIKLMSCTLLLGMLPLAPLASASSPCVCDKPTEPANKPAEAETCTLTWSSYRNDCWISCDQKCAGIATWKCTKADGTALEPFDETYDSLITDAQASRGCKVFGTAYFPDEDEEDGMSVDAIEQLILEEYISQAISTAP